MPDENGKDFAYGMDGNDTIILGGCDDFIWGGKGDDIIKSGSGNDIIYYELGDGNDIIDDTTGRWTYPASGYDVVYLGEGILPEEVRVTLSADSYDFILHITKSGETITLPGNTYSGFTPVFPIEEIHFMDGTTWNRDDFLEIMRTIYGTDGNDSIRDSGDNDTVFCGKGNDFIRGGTGDDLYIYQLGDGCDTILDASFWGSGNNTLQFGEGITMDDLYQEAVRYEGENYTRIYVKDRSSYVQMQGIQNIAFADGEPIVWKNALAEMAPASELTSELTGDLSCDGTISADDVRMLIAYLTNTSSLNYSVDADINQDGVLNVTDLTLLKQICLKSK